jgi:dTDP-4-amino-4,6-dideoxygalactose transaminase
MNNKPALVGGMPAFEQLVPMVRPVLPSFEELEEGIHHILNSGMVTRGRYLNTFEQELASHLEVRHAIAVSSCTSGLMLAYKGLGLSGEVVVPSFTFMATVSALVWCGLKPVFADVHPGTTNLDPASVEAAVTSETTAIVAVHNFGNPADIEALENIARRRGLKLVFDAAHGFGARYKDSPVGGQGNVQVFSLSPTKLLISGEGGVVATNDDDLAHKVRVGREYGNDGSYDSAFPGLNARMPELSALLGLNSLKNLEYAAESRNRIAESFREGLEILPGLTFQEVRPVDRHSYREFSVVVDQAAFGLSRDQLALALKAENVDTRKYYDPPVHCHTAYKQFYYGAPLPSTELLAANSLSLPMWSKMDPEIILGITGAFRRIQENAPAVSKVVDG